MLTFLFRCNRLNTSDDEWQMDYDAVSTDSSLGPSGSYPFLSIAVQTTEASTSSAPLTTTATTAPTAETAHFNRVSLNYINNNYYRREGEVYVANDRAWCPEHRLCFEHTTEETLADNSDVQVQVTYDIDALKGVILLRNLGMAVNVPLLLMQPLESRHSLVREKNTKVMVQDGTTWKMKNIGTLPNIKFGKMVVEDFGEVSLYLVFDNAQALESQEEVAQQPIRLRNGFVASVEAAILTALDFDCDGAHGHHMQFDNSEVSALQALFMLTREGLATVTYPAYRPIQPKFMPCFCHCLCQALPTAYGNCFVYFHSIGNKGATQVSSVEGLDEAVERLTVAIDPIPFLSLDIDLGVRRWATGRQALTTWATRSSIEDREKVLYPVSNPVI
jgi:hypothetical protein